MPRDIVTSENRDEYIENKLNPKKDKKLGKVHLEDEDNISHIFHEGKKVGQIEHKEKDGMIQILRSDVEKEHQGKGIGTEAYQQFIDRALKSGKSVGSDSTIKDHGQSVWNKLQKKYKVEKSKNVGLMRGAITTTTRDFRLANRNKNGMADVSGHEPVYQIHPKKEKQ